MLRRLDDWLIDRAFQPLADRLAGWGSPQEIGRSLIIGSTAFRACRLYEKWLAGNLDITEAAIDGLAIALWWVNVFFRQENPPLGVAPSERALYRLTRVLFILFFVPAYAIYGAEFLTVGTVKLSVFTFACDFLLMSGLYIMACRRHPPKPRHAGAPSGLMPVSAKAR